MRPASMLPHSRRDCDTFCDHQRYRIDSDSDGSWIQGGRRVLVESCDIVFAVAARHGDGEFVFVCIARQRRSGRDECVVVVVGIYSYMSRSASSEKNTHLLSHGCLYVRDRYAMPRDTTVSLSYVKQKGAGNNVGEYHMGDIRR